jgi:aldose 1-epimerase
MAPETIVELTAGPLRMELSPSIGGSISAFEWDAGAGRQSILRHSGNRGATVLESASFPLVPYVNRIRAGRFSFRGREVRLQPNMAADPSPLHGQGWLNPWQVDAVDQSSAVLSFVHAPGEWPWAYRAVHSIALDDNGVSLRLVCHNIGAEPMPCGLGEHPYFPCGTETRIFTRVEDAWTVDAQVLPVEKVPAEGRYELWDRPVCARDLDNGFAGWGGVARFEDPDWPYDLELRSPGTRFFQLYSPPAGGIFVAEPVTHANAALNAPEEEWPELGMRVLEPGEAMALDTRLEVIAK